MRVIAGKARHLQLKTPEGMNTRPTTDRIKETLFNMIHNNLPDRIFIDLYSGSGGIGIEALSRGAKHCYFIENDSKALECIRHNLRTTKLTDDADVINADVISGLMKIEARQVVSDIIFMDPPYNKGEEKRVLEYLKTSRLIDEYSTIIVEAAVETEFDYLEIMGFEVVKYKKYGSNAHVFIQIKQR